MSGPAILRPRVDPSEPPSAKRALAPRQTDEAASEAPDDLAPVDGTSAEDVAPGDASASAPAGSEETIPAPVTGAADIEVTPTAENPTLDDAAPPASVETSAEAEVTSATAHNNTNGAAMTDNQTSLNDAMQIDGALGVALVDTSSGMALGTAGTPPIDLNVAAAGNSSVVQAKLRTMKELGLSEKLEDILITLESQYHIIRTLGSEDGLFLYLVLDKERANLAMARFKLAKIEKDFQL